MDGVVFLNNIWVYCMQFLCDELADMTIPRWTAHPIPPARSPIREILPMIPATAMAISKQNRSAKKVRKGNIHSSCRSSNPPSARACLSDKASVCSRLCRKGIAHVDHRLFQSILKESAEDGGLFFFPNGHGQGIIDSQRDLAFTLCKEIL